MHFFKVRNRYITYQYVKIFSMDAYHLLDKGSMAFAKKKKGCK